MDVRSIDSKLQPSHLLCEEANDKHAMNGRQYYLHCFIIHFAVLCTLSGPKIEQKKLNS